MVELFANSGDPDQMPRSAASDLGLHCLPVTLLGVSRLQWVNNYMCWVLISETLLLKGLNILVVFLSCFARDMTYVTLVCFPAHQTSEKESTLKGKNLLLKRSKFFSFRVVSYIRRGENIVTSLGSNINPFQVALALSYSLKLPHQGISRENLHQNEMFSVNLHCDFHNTHKKYQHFFK